MKTDKTFNGKTIFKCDTCGLEEIGGKLQGWVKYGDRDFIWYVCTNCKYKLSLAGPETVEAEVEG